MIFCKKLLPIFLIACCQVSAQETTNSDNIIAGELAGVFAGIRSKGAQFFHNRKKTNKIATTISSSLSEIESVHSKRLSEKYFDGNSANKYIIKAKITNVIAKCSTRDFNKDRYGVVDGKTTTLLTANMTVTFKKVKPKKEIINIIDIPIDLKNKAYGSCETGIESLYDKAIISGLDLYELILMAKRVWTKRKYMAALKILVNL